MPTLRSKHEFSFQKIRSIKISPSAIFLFMLYNEIMAITPQTDIYLLKCPIEADNRNQINFATATAQYEYFSSLPKLALDGCTYQRKDDVMRLPYHIDDIINYNYVMYRNEAYGNKWFYAFITNMEYSSDHMTFVSIKTDVYQTWQFDLTFMKSFVEREHVNDDTFGANTVPEGLEYGDYIVNAKSDMGASYGWADCVLVVQVSDTLSAMQSTWVNKDRIYGGLPNGCWYIPLHHDPLGVTLYQNFTNMVKSYDAENKADAIVGAFVMPKTLLGITASQATLDLDATYPFTVYVINDSASASTLGTYTISKPTAIDTFTPKNNKTLCSPYSYLMITNNGGTDVCYAWEEFTSTPSFTERGIPNQGCDIKLTPSNYKKTDLAGGYEWSVSRQKFPTVSWNSDFYLNWVAVNGKYMEVQAGLTAMSWGSSMLSGMLTGNVSGMVNGTMGLAQSVAQQAQQIREAKMTPDSARGNTNTGDLNYTLGKNCFTAYKMTIKKEYAKIIDDYFTAFGYRVNAFKVPNITGRKYWNYVHTIGANIEGNIPQADMDEIKSMFDRGITIWHDTSHYLDYTQNNTIL